MVEYVYIYIYIDIYIYSYIIPILLLSSLRSQEDSPVDRWYGSGLHVASSAAPRKARWSTDRGLSKPTGWGPLQIALRSACG